jgi:hypothetical protein
MLGSAAAALAITALAAPAAAADTTGTLAIVNGIPGAKVDVCIGGKELRSKLSYGGVYRKNVISVGSKRLKFYKKDPRTCRGQLLGSKLINVSAGTDLTIVVTRKAPKVVVFDNASPLYMGEVPPRGAPYPATAFISWASAADFDTNFIYTLYSATVGPSPWAPAANPVWSKGDRYTEGIEPIYIAKLMATMPDDPAAVSVRSRELEASRRHEWVLVGTNKSNAKFVLVDRGVSQPSA